MQREVDQHLATELVFMCDNFAPPTEGEPLPRSHERMSEASAAAQRTSIRKSLAAKMARGEYDHGKASMAWDRLVSTAAQHMVRWFGGPYADAATREHAARILAGSFRAEAELGNYDYLLPAKYAARHRTLAKGNAEVQIELSHVAAHRKDILEVRDEVRRVWRRNGWERRNANGSAYITRKGREAAAEGLEEV